MPEEQHGNWSKAWHKGDIDICFTENYEPNPDSVARFKKQFRWERSHNSWGIPNWAWGHAVALGIETKVPAHVPKGFDWPKLQKAWRLSKFRGESTALSVEAAQVASSARRKRLMAEWQRAHEKPNQEARREARRARKKAKHAQPNSAQPKPAETKRAELKPAQPNPGQLALPSSSAQPKPGQLALPSSSAEPEPGQRALPGIERKGWADQGSESSEQGEPYRGGRTRAS